jgi:hypothetical protein
LLPKLPTNNLGNTSMTEQNVSPTKIPTVHITNGEIGGIGKSTFAKILAEFYRSHQQVFTIVDMDASTPNVAQAYARDIVAAWAETRTTPPVGLVINDFFGAKSSSTVKTPTKKKAVESVNSIAELLSEQIVLSAEPSKAYLGDRLLEIITTDPQIDTILSMPAQIDRGLRYWLDKNNIDRHIGSGDLPFQIVNWWVSNGSEESMKLLADFIDSYPHIKHVMVANRGIVTAVPNWRFFTPSARLTKHAQAGNLQGISIELLALDPNLMAQAQREQLTYAEIMDLPKVSSFVRLRIKDWLAESFAVIRATGLCSI